MSANIKNDSSVKQLDRRAEPDEQVTEEQVKDSSRLGRLLMTMLRDIALLKRRWAPRRMDFEDVVVDGTATTKYRLTHKFGGRVRWWPVDWLYPSASGLAKHSDTDNDTLVLVSYVAGTVTIRVEEAG